MVMKPFVSQTPPVTLRRTHGDTAQIDSSYSSPGASIPGGTAQSSLMGTQEVQMAKPRVNSGPGRSFCFWGDGGLHFSRSSLSTRWESPPAVTVLHTSWHSHPLQGDFATCPIKRESPAFCCVENSAQHSVIKTKQHRQVKSWGKAPSWHRGCQ